MQVIDALPAILMAVDHRAVAGGGNTEFACQTPRRAEQFAEQGVIIVADRIEAGVMGFRDDQEVRRRLRKEIAKSDDALVFKEQLRLCLMPGDFAEDTVHIGLLRRWGSPL